jgi:uncharacterized protein (DUF2267 family)
VDLMQRDGLLERIRELGGVDTTGRAAAVLRAVMDALTDEMTDEEIRTMRGHLPEEFRADWAPDVGHPRDILEKEEMLFEPGVKR